MNEVMTLTENHLLIGQLAKKFGISPKTIRWYEDNGLLEKTERSDSNYRLYSQKDVERLSFIRKALAIGFAVKDIQEILQIRHTGALPCQAVRLMLEERIDELSEQIEIKKKFLIELKSLQTHWQAKLSSTDADDVVCPLIEEGKPGHQ
jgi:MerR family transcriptional regulator, copper efflux regulator